MREKVITVRRARMVKASADQAWSLLASPAALWSLRPSRFSFRADSPDEGLRLWVVLGIRPSGSFVHDVFEITDEMPGRSLTLSRVSPASPGQELSLCFSASPGARGTEIALTVRQKISFLDVSTYEPWWQVEAKAWLAACAEAFAGRRPLARDEPPPDVQAACVTTLRPVRDMTQAITASAATLVSAPPDRTWRLIYSPASSLRVSPCAVAAGRVPGSPSNQAGEIQYLINRADDGLLHLRWTFVDALDDGRTALGPPVGAVFTKTAGTLTKGGSARALMDFQVEPAERGSRLTVTLRVAPPATEEDRQAFEESLAMLLSGYKSFVEDAQVP